MTTTPNQFPRWNELPEEMRQMIYEFAYGGPKKPIVGKVQFNMVRGQHLQMDDFSVPAFEPAVNQLMVSKEFFRDAAAAFCKAIVLDYNLVSSDYYGGYHEVLKCRLLQCYVNSATISVQDQVSQLPNFSNLKTLKIKMFGWELPILRDGRRAWLDIFNDADFKHIAFIKPLKKIRGLKSFSCGPRNNDGIPVHPVHMTVLTQNVARLEAYLLPFVTAAKSTTTQREAYDSIYPGSRVSQVKSGLLPERFGGRVLRPRSQKKNA